MNIDLSPLENQTRLLFTVELAPLQGERFQPTGFPSLGAATYQTRTGPKLLVESAQSMANRLEATCWDAPSNAPIACLRGISHVTVTRRGAFLTDTMLEAHRLNSPYLLESKCDKSFFEMLQSDLGALEDGPIDRKLLARVLLNYDVGSLLHGVFLAKPALAGGRLRVARALSAFVEASGVRVAASGGVKNDQVNPSGITASGFGNVPFARDEFTADQICCHINLDLSQIRGFGLGTNVERLLVLLALHRVRRLLDGDLRLRTACDLEPKERARILATRPSSFALPDLESLETALRGAIEECSKLMTHRTFAFEDALTKGKDDKTAGEEGEQPSESDEE